MPDLARRIAVARGDEPADLVVRGGRVFSVFTREWLDTDVAIPDGYVAGLGAYEGREVARRLRTLPRAGLRRCAHAHRVVEAPRRRVRARWSSRSGTTAVVADPHEIANVLGHGRHPLVARRVRRTAARRLRHGVFLRPGVAFESPRRPLTIGDIQALLRQRRVIGLAEMMNFPGVIAGDPAELEKLGWTAPTHVDGHAPGVRGKALQRLYRGRDPLRPRGVHVRGGPSSGARGHVGADPRGIGRAQPARLLPLSPSTAPTGCAFCTDDREPDFMSRRPHQLDGAARGREGISPEDAIVMATLNPATYHRLCDLGAIAPGYQADLLLLDDLESFRAAAGAQARPAEPSDSPGSTCPTGCARRSGYAHEPARLADFRIPWRRRARARVIGVIPAQLFTERGRREPAASNGCVVADRRATSSRSRWSSGITARDAWARARTRVGLKRGALASTVAPRRAQHRRRRRRRRDMAACATAGSPRSAAESSSSRTGRCSKSCRSRSRVCCRTAARSRYDRRSRGAARGGRQLGCMARVAVQTLASSPSR